MPTLQEYIDQTKQTFGSSDTLQGPPNELSLKDWLTQNTAQPTTPVNATIGAGQSQPLSPSDYLSQARQKEGTGVDDPVFGPIHSAIKGAAQFGRTVSDTSEKAMHGLDQYFGKPIKVGGYIQSPTGEQAQVLSKDYEAGTIETDKGRFPMSEEQKRWADEIFLGDNYSRYFQRAVAQGVVGLSGFVGGAPKYLEPEKLVPEGTEDPAGEVLKSELTGLGDMSSELLLALDYQIRRGVTDDPSKSRNNFNPFIAGAYGIKNVAALLSGGETGPVTQEDYRRIVGASQEQPETLYFSGQILKGGAHVGEKILRKTTLLPETAPSVLQQGRVSRSKVNAQTVLDDVFSRTQEIEAEQGLRGQRPLEPKTKLQQQIEGVPGRKSAKVSAETFEKALERPEKPTESVSSAAASKLKEALGGAEAKSGARLAASRKAVAAALKPPKPKAAPKKAKKVTPEAVAKKHGIEFKGSQEGAKGKPIAYEFYDPTTEGNLTVRTLEEVPDRIKVKRKEFAEGEAKKAAKAAPKPKKKAQPKGAKAPVESDRFTPNSVQAKDFARTLDREGEIQSLNLVGDTKITITEKQGTHGVSGRKLNLEFSSKVDRDNWAENAIRFKSPTPKPAKAKGAKAKQVKRQPWEMTADEAADIATSGKSFKSKKLRENAEWAAIEKREQAIIDALQRGEKVSRAILDEGTNWHGNTQFRDFVPKDYPGLKALGIGAGAVLTAHQLATGEDVDGLVTAAIGLGAIAGSKGKGKGRRSGPVNIEPMKSYWERVSAPNEIRPGIKLEARQIRQLKADAARSLGILDQMKIGKQGQLIAPSGWGKRLSKQMELEMTRRQISLAQQHGIAIKTTKSGKPVPNVKKSGVAVPVEMAEWEHYKDIEPGQWGGTKDITRAIQEMDGSLDIKQKAKLEGQAGPLEQNVLWRARDIENMKGKFVKEQTVYLKSLFDNLSKVQETQISKLLDGIISNRMAHIPVEKLAKFGRVKAITSDPVVLEKAQKLRQWYDTMRVRQNEIRVMRGQKEIPYRKFYEPHALREITIWERTMGLRLRPEDLKAGVPLPDYIHPEAAFNPHAMARMEGIADWAKETNSRLLAERYANAAASDMFHTSIIQNTKAFATQMDAMGFPKNGQFLRDWASEAYGGVKGKGDRWFNIRPLVVGGRSFNIPGWLTKFRRARALMVFPLNFSWNFGVQTLSSVLTYARYGETASIRGFKDWAFDPALRQEIAKNAYSYRVKADKSGRITQQDVDTGGASRVQLRQSKMDTARDAANYLTEMIERNLTGWSIATGRRHGIKHGLTGKGLWEYASDAGAKTQSMYNRADLPGVLRNEVVKTAAPFQTFSFEMYNTMKELAGKTGMSMGTFKNRMGFSLRLLAGMYVTNQITGAVFGREPWEVKSFIPFSNFWLEPIISGVKGKTYTGTARQLPGGASEAYTVVVGISDYIKTGDVKALRRFLVRYGTGFAGIPGGIQYSRMIDGAIAVAEGGVYDNLGALKYPVTKTSEQVRAVLTGPSSTKAGQKYFASRDKSFVDLFFKDKPAKDRFRRQKTKARNAIKNKKYNEARRMIDDWNKTFNGTTLQMPLFEQMYLDVLNRELNKERKDAREQ